MSSKKYIDPHFFSVTVPLTRTQIIQVAPLKLEIERAEKDGVRASVFCQAYFDHEPGITKGTLRIKGALLPHEYAQKIKAVLDEYAITLIGLESD